MIFIAKVKTNAPDNWTALGPSDDQTNCFLDCIPDLPQTPLNFVKHPGNQAEVTKLLGLCGKRGELTMNPR